MAMILMVVDSICKHDSIVCNSILDNEDGGLSLSAYYGYKRVRPTEFELKMITELDEACTYSLYERPTVPLEKAERLRRLNARHVLPDDYQKIRNGGHIIYNRALRNTFHQKMIEKIDRERPRLIGK